MITPFTIPNTNNLRSSSDRNMQLYPTCSNINNMFSLKKVTKHQRHDFHSSCSPFPSVRYHVDDQPGWLSQSREGDCRAYPGDGAERSLRSLETKAQGAGPSVGC